MAGDGATRAQILIGLQRTHGNRAVQRLLDETGLARGSQPLTQRVASSGGTASSPPAPRNEIEILGSRLKSHQLDLQLFLSKAKDDVKNIRSYFRWVNDVYVRCYGHHELVTSQAKAIAESQQAWADVAFGVATGVAVGALFEVAVAAAGITLSYELLMEVAGEVVEGGIASIAKGDESAVKSAEELAPALKRVQALEQLDKLNVAVLGMAVPGSFIYTNPIVQTERLVAELRVAEAGGQRRMSDGDIRQRYLDLMKFDVASMKVENDVKAIEIKFDDLRKAYLSKQAPSDQRCEQDIWIPWIAKQSSQPTSFFQLGILLNSKLLMNHFVDIGLATRGGRGGRLNADVSETHGQHRKGAGYVTVSPAEQLVEGAEELAPELPAYWKGVFLEGEVAGTSSGSEG